MPIFSGLDVGSSDEPSMQEAFEMKDLHRSLIDKNRIFLLHNLRPNETLWSTLVAKDVFPGYMIEDMKVYRLFILFTSGG